MENILIATIAVIATVTLFLDSKFNILLKIKAISPRYRPLKDLSAIEAGLLKDNFVEFKELIPAILELANLGFIEIIEDERGTLIKKAENRRRDLNSAQLMIMYSLFKNSTLVPTTAIRIRSYHFDDIKRKTYNLLVEKGYYRESVSRSRKKFILSVAAILASTFTLYIFYLIFQKIIPFNTYTFIPVATAIYATYRLYLYLKYEVTLPKKTLFTFTLISIFFIYFYSNSIILALAPIVIMLIIYFPIRVITKRINTLTKKGIEAKRELLGLREFISRVDVEKIDFMLNENSSYLDIILPYAVLFELNSHWLKLYKALEAKTPYWFKGSLNSFSSIEFSGVID